MKKSAQIAGKVIAALKGMVNFIGVVLMILMAMSALDFLWFLSSWLFGLWWGAAFASLPLIWFLYQVIKFEFDGDEE